MIIRLHEQDSVRTTNSPDQIGFHSQAGLANHNIGGRHDPLEATGFGDLEGYPFDLLVIDDASSSLVDVLDDDEARALLGLSPIRARAARAR